MSTASKTSEKYTLFLGLLAVGATLLTAVVPAYVAYDLYNKGPQPQKQLQLSQWPQINPMKDLSVLGNKVHLNLTVENTTIDNLIIAHAFLENTGTVPILPSDYFEKLTVSVEPPWRIVTVENARDAVNDVRLKWKRAGDGQFEAEPALLNPHDRVSTLVYLTNTVPAESIRNDKAAEPALQWSLRVANLRGISEPPRPDYSSSFAWGGLQYFPVIVSLEGFGVVFTLIAASIFETLYLLLLTRIGFASTLVLAISWVCIGRKSVELFSR